MRQASSLFILSVLTMLLLPAIARADSSQPTIVDHITAEGTNNVILLPDELLQRLVFTASPAPEEDATDPSKQAGRAAGFRVQVFSDNNARTAKNEARSNQRLVAARFPQYQIYVQYNSPYWRVKVGDFRTQQEANAAAEEMKKAFPNYQKEIRVVRDRIAH